MHRQPQFPVKVFYDGECSVCAMEIEHYLGLDRDGRLIPIDISPHDFDPTPYRIPMERFRSEMHVIDQAGVVFRGVDAFWAIWQAFPSSSRYGFLGRLVCRPLVNPIARLLYRAFARIRPYLPKRRSCSSGTCSIRNHEGCQR